MLDIGANLLFLKPHRGYCIPARPEAFPIEVSLSSAKLASHSDGALALDIANHLGHRILRRNPDEHVDMVLHHMSLYDGAPALPSQLTQHRPKKTPALAIQRFLPALRDKDYVIFTSHFEWLRLSYDDVVIQFAPCGPPSPQRAYDNIIFHCIFRPSLESLPGQTRGLEPIPIGQIADT